MLAGIAAKIDREEVYHRLHAEMWSSDSTGSRATALPSTSCGRSRWACWSASLRPALAERLGRDDVEAVERSTPGEEFAALWEEMTMVRRSAPAGAQW